jgi:polyisoprenoid-binding protein YceI
MAWLLAFPERVFSQKYISKTSTITFFSEAPLENIEAVNSKATSLIDLETGEIVFSVPIDAFQFKKSLMKQHFNENYMDTEIYPKSTFKGKVTGYQKQDGKYQAKAEGLLTIHGVTNPLSVEGEMRLSEDEISINTSFPVLLEDYKIKIPRILFSNIAESVDVKVQFVYQPYVSK